MQYFNLHDIPKPFFSDAFCSLNGLANKQVIIFYTSESLSTVQKHRFIQEQNNTLTLSFVVCFGMIFVGNAETGRLLATLCLI